MPTSKLPKQITVALLDGVLVALSISLSYMLRFSTPDMSKHINQMAIILPLLIVVRLCVFWLAGLYRGMWRFTGMHDLLSLLVAVSVSSALAMTVLFLVFRLQNYPRSVFLIDWFVTMVLVGGCRFAYRLYRENWLKSVVNPNDGTKKVLIIGAGRAGEMLLRELISNYRSEYLPIGFVDDDRANRNMTIHGVQVLGNTRDIPRIAAKYAVDEAFLAIPEAAGATRRRIMHTCKRAGIRSKTLPGSGELLARVSLLRQIQIEDLLGREPAKMDTASIQEYLQGKTVLITGAGGSIGSELCRQVALFAPKRIVLFERSEYNLYQIHLSLSELFPDVQVQPVIGDVLNQARVEQAFAKFMPEVVFHAAAYKHVPLMEMNPVEALWNNVQGTSIVARCAHAYGVRKFVMVSTDKAVRPANIMGASKRIAELICQAIGAASATQFVTVRFGNVLNSVGSVIPRFKEQIERGGPVTVTHPEIYRYFMTIPESVQLIMQAGSMGKGGELFILDMGEPVKIVDLARDMITLSGLVPGRDIRITFSGLRPGEKLYEELLTDGEEVKSTLHEKIKVIDSDEIEPTAVVMKVEMLLESLRNGFSRDVVDKVKEIVPEYRPENGGPRSVVTGQDGGGHAHEIVR